MERGDSFLDISSNRSMQLVNDPRFMATNIIDKRLGAFDKMGVISGLLTGTALEACFRLTKYLNFGICVPAEAHTVVESIVQLVSFVIMSSILFMSLYSTLVSVYQAYYTYRLMTAGANGFELARTFYLDPVMVKKTAPGSEAAGLGLAAAHDIVWRNALRQVLEGGRLLGLGGRLLRQRTVRRADRLHEAALDIPNRKPSRPRHIRWFRMGPRVPVLQGGAPP